METKEKQWNRWQKSRLILLLAAAVLITAISGTLAWFSSSQRIQTATLIEMPDIYIEGPDGENSQLIQLGDIDVTNGTSREYVFRVVTTSKYPYQLQLAHTTNIPFRYAIYHASTSGSGNAAYAGGNPYYYSEDTVLNGTELVQEATHGVTYGSYEYVHPDAEPQYWQSEPVQPTADYSYYVLVVSWISGLKNNKETDMVYLTVNLARKIQTP